MRIFVGADHRGFLLKKELIEKLIKSGHDVIDVGTDQEGVDCDYPEISFKVAEGVAQDPAARGILICMTGLGHVITANKVPGAYAALCYNKEAAEFSRKHNNSNILVLGARFVSQEQMDDIVVAWLETAFEGGRHERRVNQIKEIEKRVLLKYGGKE